MEGEERMARKTGKKKERIKVQEGDGHRVTEEDQGRGSDNEGGSKRVKDG